jgi:uncharacterized membrane protein
MKNALLFTNNATIKKLFALSLEKKGLTLIEGDINNPTFENTNIVFIDNEIFSEDLLSKIGDNLKKVLILGKNEEKRDGFDDYMIKPFLPENLLDLISKLEDVSHNNDEISTPIDENSSSQDDFNIDDDLDFDDIKLDDELNSLDDDLDLGSFDGMETDSIEDNTLVDNDDLDFDDEPIPDDEIQMEDDAIVENEKKEEEDLSFEEQISKLSETDVAKAIGEEIDIPTHKIEEEKMEEETIPKEENLEDKPIPDEKIKEEKTDSTQTNEEKVDTVASLLNLNLEALKNSGATITITIKFDKE